MNLFFEPLAQAQSEWSEIDRYYYPKGKGKLASPFTKTKEFPLKMLNEIKHLPKLIVRTNCHLTRRILALVVEICPRLITKPLSLI